MKRSALKVLGFALLAILFTTTLPAKEAKEKGLLDGKVFAGELVEKGKNGKTHKDDLVFKNEKFRSSACDVFGFKPVAYETAEKGKGIKFKAVAVNASGDTMKWEGKMKGDELKAKAVLSKKDAKKPTKFSYEGKLKVKKPS